MLCKVAFRPILLISCAGVTGRWSSWLSHAQNAVRWLALSKRSVEAFQRYLIFVQLSFEDRSNHNCRVVDAQMCVCMYRSTGGTGNTNGHACTPTPPPPHTHTSIQENSSNVASLCAAVLLAYYGMLPWKLVAQSSHKQSCVSILLEDARQETINQRPFSPNFT